MLITGGRVIDPAAGIDALLDIRISAVVEEIGEHLLAGRDETVFDAAGAIVAPGFIDMHVHLREPGFPEKETIETGTAAAVRGGFTAVACMPNTKPPLDDSDRVAALLRQTRARAACRVYPIAAITKERRGEAPCDYAALTRAGAVGFSDDGDGVADGGVLFRAAVAARDFGVFISHCEDAALRALDAALAEDAAVARDALIAAATKKRWHLAHVSTRTSVELLRLARTRGSDVSAEATPHHLHHTNESGARLGAAAAVNPPLRTADDVLAVRDAVRDGTIDVLASDHAPHTAEEKKRGLPGFSGLEIAIGAYAAALPDLPLSRFVELVSTNPSRVLGVPGGTLRQGAPADVTVVRDESWRVDASAFISKGRVTPFDGATLPRRVVATIVGGAVAYRA